MAFSGFLQLIRYKAVGIEILKPARYTTGSCHLGRAQFG
jgi:hypothetical protein